MISRRAPLRFFIARVWRHLTRTRAVGGWLLAVTCITVYAVYREEWPLADPIGQGALMAASVALGAIALPELSANLWSVSSLEVRNLIPTAKVSSLQRSLVQAQSDDARHDPGWADTVVDSALVPLVTSDPHQVVRAMTYDIDVHLDQRVEWDEVTVPVQLFKTELRSRRKLHPEVEGNVFWIAIARDISALHDEFARPNCLSREVSSVARHLNDEDWCAMMRANSAARLVVDGRVIDGEPETTANIGEGSARVVRWYFESTELQEATEKSKLVRILFEYPECPDVRHFPAAFSSYYVTGGLQVGLTLHDPRRRFDLECDAFLASTLPHDSGVPVKRHSAVGVESTLVISDDTLVFPGSGVHFWWTEVKPDE